MLGLDLVPIPCFEVKATFPTLLTIVTDEHDACDWALL